MNRDMNDDRLSPREHQDMRDALLAGTQRIRPVGAHRMQIIAASVALVLVAGVTGGAIATASMLGSAPIQPAVTATPTPTPSATRETPAPTPEPPVGPTVAFGGECSHVLTDADVFAVRDMPMERIEYRWRSGQNELRGGIDCLWLSPEAYVAAVVHVFAFPEATMPASTLEAYRPGCFESSDGSQVACATTGVIDGTRLLVSAQGAKELITAADVDTLYASAAARLTEYAPPVAATPTPEWWAPMDCAAIVGRIDPAVYGFERVAVAEGSASTGDACAVHFTSGEGDATTGTIITVTIVPGGALTFPTVLEAAGARATTVVGAQSAVVVPGLDRYEGSPEVLVATDGVNTLHVAGDWLTDISEAANLAAVVLGLQHP